MEEKICYCFNYTADDLEQDVRENGRGGFSMGKRFVSIVLFCCFFFVQTSAFGR